MSSSPSGSVVLSVPDYGSINRKIDGNDSLHTDSNLPLKVLKEEALTREVGSLFQHVTALQANFEMVSSNHMLCYNYDLPF